MSEYQYYEFQAVDRPLTTEEMLELRAVSTRAHITSTHFVNEYNWGDFKGRPDRWMERYFDAFLYLANWGSRQLMLRLPAAALDLETAQRYCAGEGARAWAYGDSVILSFSSEDDTEDWWEEEDGHTLASILPVRAELAGGDHRALYLAWLLCAQTWEMEDDEPEPVEPPVPPGLQTPSGALQAFIDFLRIDPNLVRAAAERSPPAPAAPDAEEVRAWIAALPDGERVDLLARVAGGEERRVQAELRWRVQASRAPAAEDHPSPRTVQELLDAAERITEERRRAEAEAAAREKARREREAAAARRRHLDTLAGREEEMWRRVHELVASTRPAAYDEAAALLADLRDLASRDGDAAEFDARVHALRQQHARKPAFLQRLRKVVG